MGGAASPPAMVREAMARFDAAYSIRYSSTESGGCGTGTAFDADEEEALFTVGRPRGGIEIGICDDEAGPLPDGEVGEVWLRSPTSMSGYWRDDEATDHALARDWLRTGDLGFIDERGCLRLAGRLKEMFIRGGYNVYPAEVESVLADHPAVADVAVVPRPDDVMGEIGVAVVVPADRRSRRRPSRSCARSSSPGWRGTSSPRRSAFVDAIPLTPMQKVDRRGLAAEESRTAP